MTKTATSFVLFIAILAFGIAWLQPNGFSFFSNPEEGVSQTFPWAMLAVSIVGMALGMLFAAVYKQYDAAKENISFKQALNAGLKSNDFAKSLIVAPIVFVIVYKAAATHPDFVIGFVFAFQNGFFCQKVLGSTGA